MNGHTPTRRQKDYLSHHGYLEDSWLVLKDTKEQMVIKNRKYPRGLRRYERTNLAIDAYVEDLIGRNRQKSMR